MGVFSLCLNHKRLYEAGPALRHAPILGEVQSVKKASKTILLWYL
jgi:hypothetical protein